MPSYGELSPGGRSDTVGCVKVEETSPYSIQENAHGQQSTYLN